MRTQQVVILDTGRLDVEKAKLLMRALGSKVWAIKAHALYDELGPGIVERLHDWGAERVFVDYKIHDTPDTAWARTKAIGKSGADILSVHIDGGAPMMREAVNAAALSTNLKEVWGVTQLSSMYTPLQRNKTEPKGQELLDSASTALASGLTGIIAPGWYMYILARQLPRTGTKLIATGVRSLGKPQHDHFARITPADCMINGATHIVVGRQVAEAPDPLAALEEIEAEISVVEV